MTDTAAGGSLLRRYLSESDRWGGRPLHDSIARECLRHGLAGVAVLRGIEVLAPTPIFRGRRDLVTTLTGGQGLAGVPGNSLPTHC